MEFWILGNHIQYSNYWFSSHGRVYSLKKNMILPGSVTPRGYIDLDLTDDNGIKGKKKLHQMIAILFIGPPPDKDSTVDHINRISVENHFRNLRWASKSEQARNQDRSFNRSHRLIYQFTPDMVNYQTWISLNLAAETLGLRSKTISEACQNNKLYGGYYWRYSEDVEIREGEVFKQIPGYSRYQVSNLGRVKYPNGRITAGSLNPSGYYKTSLISDSDTANISRQVYIHKLVMLAFVGEKKQGMVVNHKNGVKSDNRVENLEYITPKENTIHARDTGLIKMGAASKLAVPIIRTNLDGSNPVYYGSMADAARDLNNKNLTGSISNACKGKIAYVSGYKWYYYRDVQHLYNVNIPK